MILEDSNPYRRNYMLASVGFLLFWLAGGELNSTMKIGLIGLELSRPWVLCILYMIMWAWFLRRYNKKTPNPAEALEDDFVEAVFDNQRLLDKGREARQRSNRHYGNDVVLLPDYERFRNKPTGDEVKIEYYSVPTAVSLEKKLSIMRTNKAAETVTFEPSLARKIYQSIQIDINHNRSAFDDWYIPHYLAGIAALSMPITLILEFFFGLNLVQKHLAVFKACLVALL